MDDAMRNPTQFAGVIDLLKKQEIGFFIRPRRHLQTLMLCLAPRPWIPAFGGMTTLYARGWPGMTTLNTSDCPHG